MKKFLSFIQISNYLADFLLHMAVFIITQQNFKIHLFRTIISKSHISYQPSDRPKNAIIDKASSKPLWFGRMEIQPVGKCLKRRFCLDLWTNI